MYLDYDEGFYLMVFRVSSIFNGTWLVLANELEAQALTAVHACSTKPAPLRLCALTQKSPWWSSENRVQRASRSPICESPDPKNASEALSSHQKPPTRGYVDPSGVVMSSPSGTRELPRSTWSFPSPPRVWATSSAAGKFEPQKA